MSRWFDGSSKKHQVRLGQQQLGQHQAVLLAAAERGHRLSEALLAEPQAVQHPLDLVIEVVGVLPLELALEMVVAGGQPVVLGRVVRLAHLLGHLDRLALQLDQAGQGAARLFPEGAVGCELGLLFEITQVGRRVEPAGTAVGIVLAGQDPATGSSCRCRWDRPARSAPRAARRK